MLHLFLSIIFSFSFFSFIHAEDWTCPIDLSPPTTNIEDTVIVKVDGSGNGFAVWIEGDNVTNVVKGARFDAATEQWSLSAPLSSSSAEELQLDVTSDGKAIAVWRRVDSNYTKVEYVTYKEGAWGTSAPIDTTHSDTTDELYPQIGVDSHGNALAIWLVGGTPGDLVRKGVYHFATDTWEQIEDLSTSETTSKQQPSLFVHPSGNAIALWSFIDSDNSTNKIQARNYVEGLWQPIETVVSSNSTTVQELFPVATLDAKNQAVVVWTEYDSSSHDYTIESATKSCTWSAPSAISAVGNNDTFPSSSPLVDIAVDPQGNAVACWCLLDQSLQAGIVQARPCQNLEWKETVTLSNVSDIAFLIPRVSIDGQGDAYVLWAEQPISEFVVETSKFTYSDSSWTYPKVLSNPAFICAKGRIATNSSGQFFACWVRQAGSNLFIMQSSRLQ